jgi:hypothetical protein
LVSAVLLALIIVASASATAGVQSALSKHGRWLTKNSPDAAAPWPASRITATSTYGAAEPTASGPLSKAVLGATLPDFEAAYGRPDTPAYPATGFVAFELGTVDIGLDVVDVPAATYAQRVITITLGQGAQQPRVWDLAHGKVTCQTLAPPDARQTGEVALTNERNVFGIADTYSSPWLAARFPVADFGYAQQRAAPRGSFTITYTYSDDNDPQDLDNCQLSLGPPPQSA